MLNRNLRRVALLVVVLIVFIVLYLSNLSGVLMDDDEGTDMYEVWQLSEGKQPGVDYVAEQQPLFLLTGSAVVRLFDRSPTALRLVAVVQILLGAFILALAVRRLWGELTAVLALGLLLGSGLVYQQARLFRPDPMMLAWEMAGLAALLLAAKERRSSLWALAGSCYGVSVLWKPFGLFPVVAIGLYLLDWLCRDSARWKEIVRAGLIFGGSLLAVGVGASVLLYSRFGFYYSEALGHHLSVGADTRFLERLRTWARDYAVYFLVNGAFAFVVPLWLLNRSEESRQSAEARLLLAALVSPVVFLAISRPLHLRYFVYLTPFLAVLLARQFQLAFRQVGSGQPRVFRFAPLLTVITVGFASVVTQPSIPVLLLSQESGSRALAAYVAAHTAPGDKVLSDYAGINFLADRDSVYEASIIAGGRVRAGIVTGGMLIDRIETDEVQIVLVHVAGGIPEPHQLVSMVDYDRFRAYLAERFRLLTVFDRAGQHIEVYQRVNGASE